MESGRKLVFEGIDNTSRASDSIKKSLTDLHASNLKGTRDVNAALKDQNTLIEKNIKLLDLQRDIINKLVTKGLKPEQQDITGRLTERFFTKPEDVNPEQIRKYSSVLSKQGFGMAATQAPEKLVLKIQELIDLEKLQHKEISTHHLKDDEEHKKLVKENIVSFDKKFKEGEFKSITKEEILAKKGEKDQAHEIRKELGYYKEKTDDVKSDKLISIMQNLAHGNIAGAVKETAETSIGKNLPWIAALIASLSYGYQKAKQFQQIIAEDAIPEELGRRMVEANPLNPELLKNFPGQRKHRAELTEWQQAAFKSSAATGMATQVSENEQFYKDMANLGISPAEAESQRATISQAKGRRAISKELYSAQYAETVLGADRGLIGNLEKQTRYGGMSEMKDLAELVRTNFGGQAKINETLEALVGIGKSHLNVLGRVDNKLALQTMKGFLGGGSLFQNAETIAPIMGAIDQGISHPGSQFAQASMFAAASQLKPGGSFTEISRLVEQGIYGPQGNALLNTALDEIAAEVGDDDESMRTALKARFPSLTWEEIFQFVDKWKKGGKRIRLGQLKKGEDTTNQIRNIRDIQKVGQQLIKGGYLKGPTQGAKIAEELIETLPSDKLTDDDHKNLKNAMEQYKQEHFDAIPVIHRVTAELSQLEIVAKGLNDLAKADHQAKLDARMEASRLQHKGKDPHKEDKGIIVGKKK